MSDEENYDYDEDENLLDDDAMDLAASEDDAAYLSAYSFRFLIFLQILLFFSFPHLEFEEKIESKKGVWNALCVPESLSFSLSWSLVTSLELFVSFSLHLSLIFTTIRFLYLFLPLF